MDDWKLDQVRKMEQAETGVRDMAGLTATFYNELVKEGVPSEYAKELTVQFVRTQWGKGKNQ